MFFHVDQTSLSERSEAMATASEIAGRGDLTPLLLLVSIMNQVWLMINIMNDNDSHQ